MSVLGFVLASVVTSRITEAKLETASVEIERARATVEYQLDNSGSSASLQARLNSARAGLTQRAQEHSDTSSFYEPVLVAESGGGVVTSSPESYQIPERLAQFVNDGNVAYQFATVERPDATLYDALIVGTPTNADIPNLQLYLVMNMESETTTVALMRGILAIAAVIVVVLLMGIAWLASQQIVAPVRSASRTAQRFASGHLRERMPVDGEDEMAVLAMSFNNMADTLSKQINNLEEYGDLQRQFTSDVSHELRTPLTTVRMAADMIAANEDSLEPSTKRASQLMIKELDRFEALLNDLLEISRHDAGVAELSTTSMDARGPVESAWQQTQHLADELDVEVDFDIPEEPQTIEGDPRRIERIVRNLVANAIDHSEGNPVKVVMRSNDEAVAITVTDRGVGLKEGQDELVFNRFWRADKSRKRHSGGTGLGLAIAREDALLHGGILDAAGTHGVGSQFRLVLPREVGAKINVAPLDLVAPGQNAAEIQRAPVAAKEAGDAEADASRGVDLSTDSGAGAGAAGSAGAGAAGSAGGGAAGSAAGVVAADPQPEVQEEHR
ncbi:HAMP domain-containing protein [Corynebacterium coyleae]|uniref:Sensor histidine kinase MtrB n=2 Tax=Corynebacterium coyleae TaxID=53374 RepID=A0AAP6XK44_9CORY|nr:HAMP domain-containing protein [Corynebacterium coyleae]